MKIETISAQLVLYLCEYRKFSGLHRTCCYNFGSNIIHEIRQKLIDRKVRSLATSEVYTIIGVVVLDKSVIYNCLNDDSYATLRSYQIEFI